MHAYAYYSEAPLTRALETPAAGSPRAFYLPFYFVEAAPIKTLGRCFHKLFRSCSGNCTHESDTSGLLVARIRESRTKAFVEKLHATPQVNGKYNADNVGSIQRSREVVKASMQLL